MAPTALASRHCCSLPSHCARMAVHLVWAVARVLTAVPGGKHCSSATQSALRGRRRRCLGGWAPYWSPAMWFNNALSAENAQRRTFPIAGAVIHTSATAAAAVLPAGRAGSAAAAAGLGPSPRVQPLLRKLRAFMDEHVYPAGKALCFSAIDASWAAVSALRGGAAATGTCKVYV